MKRTTTARSPFIEIPLFGKCLEVFSGGVLGDGHTLSYLSDLHSKAFQSSKFRIVSITCFIPFLWVIHESR